MDEVIPHPLLLLLELLEVLQLLIGLGNCLLNLKIIIMTNRLKIRVDFRNRYEGK